MTPQDFNPLTDFNPKTAPYDIPNNNKSCLIRDCFDGTWVPGLNNIFDQAGASLKSFIDYHNTRNDWNNPTKLYNPIKHVLDVPGNAPQVPGGIGQQLFFKGIEYLKYTAYFNYDLLWFKYIMEEYLSQPPPVAPVPHVLATLLDKVNVAINQAPAPAAPAAPADRLTRDDILLINTLNINFLWCRLMIYCYKCVIDDEFFRNNDPYKIGYLAILQKLTQIRFDSFATTADGYISNPYIYYRESGKPTILDRDVLAYIEAMMSKIYNDNQLPFPDAAAAPAGASAPVIYFGHNQNVGRAGGLDGGVEYVTSQSMAATCMTQFLKLIFPGRSKTTGDATKIACMNEINRLFNLTGNKIYPGYGWSILKFSGDSAHIVFGNIMEEIRNAYTPPLLAVAPALVEQEALGAPPPPPPGAPPPPPPPGAPPGAPPPDLSQLEITYAISERPLFARLLADGKNVYSAVHNVLSKNFDGRGSENKNLKHAVMYIQWDKNRQIINLVEGLVSKVNEYEHDNNYKINTFTTTAEKLKNLYMWFPTRAPSLSVKIRAALLSAAAGTAVDVDDAAGNVDTLISIFNLLIGTPLVQNFLKDYSNKKLLKILNEKIMQLGSFANLVKEFGGGRGAGHTNWLKVMKAFNTNAPTQEEIDIRTEFDTMCEIVNLLVEYYLEGDRGLRDDEFIDEIFKIDNFQKIFKKIINAHRNKLSRGKNNEKIESFRQTREEEWRGDSKGNGDIIPGKVGYIIGRMETLLTNCFKIFERIPPLYDTGSMMRGGAKRRWNTPPPSPSRLPCPSRNPAKKKQQPPLDKDILIAAKEQLIDTLTNGQFVIEISPVQGRRSFINVNNINTTEKYNSIMQSLLPDEDKNKIKSLNGELERLRSALEPFYDDDYCGSNNSDNSNLTLNEIFANRLKKLDISIPNDFNASYNDEKRHLSAAVEYIKTTIPTYADIPVITNISLLKQYGQRYDDNPGIVISHLSSLKDMQIDNDIKIFKNTIHTKYIDNLISISNVDGQLKYFFPTLLPHYYHDFLYLIEKLSSDNPNFNLTFRNGESLRQQIPRYLIKRVEFARIISSTGLMEPMFSKLADEEYVNNLRQWPRARVNRFLLFLHHNGLQINGGKKTRRRRTSRSTNKTHRKNIQVPLQSSSASYKSTYETNGRNKTKRSNRPKKNKTRRKRNY
jgi:hypothetical protein